MKYTQIPTTAFQTMQMNAGILLSSFDPTTASVTSDNIIGATTGGLDFSAVPAFVDLGEDVDNCPKNLKELKRIDTWEVKVSGTLVTLSTSAAESLMAAASSATASSVTTITPKQDLTSADFDTLWIVGDYSEYNGSTNGGFVAIKLMNAISTGGFKLKTADKAKGQFAFEYTAHYSSAAQDTVPFVVYIKAGSAEPA